MTYNHRELSAKCGHASVLDFNSLLLAQVQIKADLRFQSEFYWSCGKQNFTCDFNDETVSNVLIAYM